MTTITFHHSFSVDTVRTQARADSDNPRHTKRNLRPGHCLLAPGLKNAAVTTRIRAIRITWEYETPTATAQVAMIAVSTNKEIGESSPDVD
jgi:hypothetical protein